MQSRLPAMSEEIISRENMGFKKEAVVCQYLDPFNGFNEKQASFEIRSDGIFGVTSRILPYRFKVPQKPNVNVYLEKSPEAMCPFCQALFSQMTPRFTQDIHPDGKFIRGNAVLFPNAFPHDRYNNVAIFSHRHFIPMDELTAEVTLDGFLVCLDYFKVMAHLHPELCFCSINWNYMPPAGGGLVHPHVQTIVSALPSRFMSVAYKHACQYQSYYGRNLWQDLIAYELEQKERIIACTDDPIWLASFAPKGMAGEISFFFNGKSSVFNLTDKDFQKILSGFSNIFKYLHANNFISFNLALYAPIHEDDNFCIQGKIVPRFLNQPLGTSDINYFEKLHDEIICPIIPEDLCQGLRPYFGTL
jgi:galactose-1-phosphate uridylyltransferase